MKKGIYFIMALVFLAISFFFDKQIIFGRNYFLDILMGGISSMIFFGVIFLICLYLIKKDKKKIFFSIGLGASYLASLILKYLIQIPRPAGSGLESFGFPSSHATVYFFIFCFMSNEKKYRNYFLILAILVSFSRIYLGKHYLSDIIGGGLLGIILCLLYKKWITF